MEHKCNLKGGVIHMCHKRGGMDYSVMSLEGRVEFFDKCH